MADGHIDAGAITAVWRRQRSIPGVKCAIKTIHSSFKVHSEVPKASVEAEAEQSMEMYWLLSAPI